MRTALIHHYYYHSSGGDTPEPSELTVSKLSVKYNDTDFAYLASSELWSDTASLGPRIISITKVCTDTFGAGSLNANTGLAIDNNFDDPADDEIIIWVIDGKNKIFIKRADITTTTTIPDLVRTINSLAGESGSTVAFDPVNKHIYADGGTTVIVADLSGNIVENLTKPVDGGQWYYDYTTGDLYVSSDSSQPVRRYRRSDGAWVLEESTWFVGSEGSAVDKSRNKIFTQIGTLREQDPTGFKTRTYPIPYTGAENEALVVDRDGTVWKNSDDYFHGSITDGNRLIHQDPRGDYQKKLLFPDIVRWSSFYGGTVSGDLADETITAETDEWIYSPVFNLESFAEHLDENNWISASNLEYEFRVSAVAPTLAETSVYNISRFENPTVENNFGWGDTVPGAFQGTRPAGQYFQFRFKILEPTPASTAWTPEDLATATLWAESIGFANLFGELEFDMYVDISDAPVANQFRVSTLINKANTDNNLVNTTLNFRPLYDSVNDYLLFTSTATRHYLIEDHTIILALSQIDIHAVINRPLTTSTVIAFTLHNTANSNDRRQGVWLPSNHATAANLLGFIENDEAGNVSYYGVAVTGTDFMLVTWRYHVEVSPGVFENQLFIDGVQQTLTVIAGTNTGRDFVSATTANTFRLGRIQGGTATPLTVRDSNHGQKFMMINSSSETDFTDLEDYLANVGITY